MKYLVASFYLLFMGITSLLFFCIALCIWCCTVLFDPRRTLLHYFTCFWGSLYLWIMPAWKVCRVGLENLPNPKTTCVIVSNHQSQLDILLGFTLFHPFKWVSKAEIFLTPFIGWNMSLNGYIKLRRGSTNGIKRMLKDSGAALTKGNSVFLFPEGTRSKDGKIQTFRSGAFKLAQKHGVPILPICIKGTSEALPKHSLSFKGVQEISISVLPMIPYETFKDMPAEEIAQLVENQIATALTEK